jgi:hypothetical protein
MPARRSGTPPGPNGGLPGRRQEEVRMSGRHRRPEFDEDKLIKLAELLTQLVLLADAIHRLI